MVRDIKDLGKRSVDSVVDVMILCSMEELGFGGASYDGKKYMKRLKLLNCASVKRLKF